MKQYLESLQFILDNGVKQPNRTGDDAITFPGYSMRFNTQEGFPAVTTKKLYWWSVVRELCGFLRGATTSPELGKGIWDGNANGPGKPGSPNQWLTNPYRKGEDDLGPVYGAQWRRWQGFKNIKVADRDSEEPDQRAIDILKKVSADNWYLLSQHQVGEHAGVDAPGPRLDPGQYVIMHKEIDQVRDCIQKLLFEPQNRRILFHAWNPAVLDEVALPSCHLLYQFLPNIETKELSLCLYIRSNDMFLGNPFNIASASLLLSIMARLTGYKPKWFTLFIGDAHIYSSHLDAVKLQLTRTPKEPPTLKISEELPTWDEILLGLEVNAPLSAGVDAVMNILDNLKPEWFTLEGYEHYDPIPAPMPV